MGHFQGQQRQCGQAVDAYVALRIACTKHRARCVMHGHAVLCTGTLCYARARCVMHGHAGQHGASTLVQAWCKHGASMVQARWCKHGASMVQAWCKHGASMVQARWAAWCKQTPSGTLGWGLGCAQHHIHVLMSADVYLVHGARSATARRRTTQQAKIVGFKRLLL